jgi:hypothetical protein
MAALRSSCGRDVTRAWPTAPKPGMQRIAEFYADYGADEFVNKKLIRIG